MLCAVFALQTLRCTKKLDTKTAGGGANNPLRRQASQALIPFFWLLHILRIFTSDEECLYTVACGGAAGIVLRYPRQSDIAGCRDGDVVQDAAGRACAHGGPGGEGEAACIWTD